MTNAEVEANGPKVIFEWAQHTIGLEETGPMRVFDECHAELMEDICLGACQVIWPMYDLEKRVPLVLLEYESLLTVKFRGHADFVAPGSNTSRDGINERDSI